MITDNYENNDYREPLFKINVSHIMVDDNKLIFSDDQFVRDEITSQWYIRYYLTQAALQRYKAWQLWADRWMGGTSGNAVEQETISTRRFFLPVTRFTG